MKYKEGDRVKIRADLEVDKQYGSRAFTQYMAKWRGQVVTILACVGNCYWLKDGEYWNWTDEMIEGLALEDDAVNHPAHYTDGQIEVIDFIRDKHLDFCRGNVVKYICRAGKKSKETELEDLKKALKYCEFAIEELEGRNGD
jgi:sulfur relay (sulfurtransferase) DsrC/TusE family protein